MSHPHKVSEWLGNAYAVLHEFVCTLPDGCKFGKIPGC